MGKVLLRVDYLIVPASHFRLLQWSLSTPYRFASRAAARVARPLYRRCVWRWTKSKVRNVTPSTHTELLPSVSVISTLYRTHTIFMGDNWPLTFVQWCVITACSVVSRWLSCLVTTFNIVCLICMILARLLFHLIHDNFCFKDEPPLPFLVLTNPRCVWYIRHTRLCLCQYIHCYMFRL